MRYFYFICLLLLPFTGTAAFTPATLVLNDSLLHDPTRTYIPEQQWHFRYKDSIQFADPAYDDSRWTVRNARFYDTEIKLLQPGYGIGWFRLTLQADADIVHKPLALVLNGDGAAWVYLDGKIIKKIGKFSSEEKDNYVKLQNTPVFIAIPAAGMHVLAIRYENKPASEDENTVAWGFYMSVNEPERVVQQVESNTRMPSLFMLTLGSLFGTLFLVHFLMYLFYKKDISNLYFALFNLSLSVLILAGYATITNDHSFSQQKVNAYIIIVSGVLSCYSINAFSTHLFSKSRLLHRINAILCLLLLLALCFPAYINRDGVSLCIGILILISALYVVILIIRAMIKRIPGSRILGAGILFFILFTGTLVAVLIKNRGGLTVNNPILGIALFCSTVLAILSIPMSLSSYLAWRFSSTSKNLQQQLDNVATLSQKSLQQEQEKQLILENQKEDLEKEVIARTREITQQKKLVEAEKQKSDELLLNILPAEVAEELKHNGKTKAQYYNEVSVLFTDFVNFTQISEELGPEELLAELNTCFTAFDNIMEQYGLEKIKTIGDAYLAVSGLPQANPEHAANAVKAGLDIIEYMQERKQVIPNGFDIRIGINSGPLVAGIVGIKKFAYDIWGDTVNTAARMEQSGEAGKVNISDHTFQLVKETFICVHRGKIKAKNKGDMDMYFVAHAR